MKFLSSTTKQRYYPSIDAVHILNLDKRTDRWMNVKTQLKKAKIPIEEVNRVSGIDGVALLGGNLDDKKTVAQKIRQLVTQDKLITEQAAQRFLEVPNKEKLYGMDLTAGAIGCALGHRKIWEMIANSSSSENNTNTNHLILEDDVEFHPSIARQFKERWSFVPSDWELVYFGGVDLLREGKPPRPFLAEGVRYAYKGHRELTAYVLNQKSARLCLEMTKPMTWQIDTHICMNCSWNEEAKDEYISSPLSYCFQPALAIQVAKFGTDVQKQHEGVEKASLTDASRRMREFVGGETSVR